jgi:hypothetical protein
MPTNIVITAYRFEELSDKAKETARQWWRDGLDYNEDIECSLQPTLEEAGFVDVQLYYSLGCCQGDGVAFAGAVSPTEFLACQEALWRESLDDASAWRQRYLRAVRFSADALGWLKDLLADDVTLAISIKHSGRYCHWNSMTVAVEIADYGPVNEGDLEALTAAKEHAVNKKVDNLRRALDEYVKVLSRRLESEGYAAIEDALSDERVDATITANDYLFTVQGHRKVTLEE